MSAAVSLTAPRKPISFIRFAKEILSIDFTPGQRVLGMVAFDGVDPIDLEDAEERALAKEIFGNVDRFAPDSRGSIVVFRLGRGSGKSLVCAAYCVYRMLTADLSMCGGGDIPAVVIIAPRAETSRIIVNYGRHMSGQPAIKPLVIASHADGFTLRRRDGMEVQFKVAAKAKGGSAVRGLSIIVAVIDESEFVPSGGANAVISDDDIIDATMPRLLPGGALILASTPWPAPSATSRSFDANFGHPETAIAARAGTLLMRPGILWLEEKVRKELIRKPANARREYFCELVDGSAGAFFELSTIDRAVATTPILATKARASAGVDVAFVNDSSAIAIVERAEGQSLVVTYLEVRSPEPQRPLIPSEVVAEFALKAREFGCREFSADNHQVKVVRRIAATVGVQVADGGTTETTLEYLREVFREGKIKIPNDKRLIEQLKSVQFKPRSGGGLTIILPRGKESGHADLVSALGQAVHFDRRFGLLATFDSAASTAGTVRGAGGGFTKW